MTYGYVIDAMRNLRLKTKYVTVDNFTTAAGAICAAIILLAALLPMAFADHETRYIAMLDEPCMMEGDEYGNLKMCYVPFKVTIDVGSVVMWENVGSTVHTVTSGTLIEPAGHFNSGLVAPNNFYSLQFAVEGIYPYYCMMHPWMSGSVVVGEKITELEKEEHLEEHEVIILEDGMFTNSTGTFYANGTAVIPEFPIAVIVLLISVTAIILLGKQKLTLSRQW